MGPRLFSASNLPTSHHQILLPAVFWILPCRFLYAQKQTGFYCLQLLSRKCAKNSMDLCLEGGGGVWWRSSAVVTNELILPNDLIFWQGATAWSVVKKIGKKKLEIWVNFSYLTMNFWISVPGAYLSQMLHLPVWKLMKLYIMLPHVCLYSSSLFGICP